jgi:hypothetical protein
MTDSQPAWHRPHGTNGFTAATSLSLLPHDAAEDVDQDGLDLLVRVQQLKGLLDLRLVGSAAHVQEVGRVAALQLHW